MRTIAAIFTFVIIFAVAAGCSQPVQVQQAPIPTTPAPIFASTPAQTPAPTPFVTQEPTVSVSANTIAINGYAFMPSAITVKAGATVRWVNEDPVIQRIQFGDGVKSQILSSGQSWSKIFDEPGVYDYSSMMYPSMQGSVTVV